MQRSLAGYLVSLLLVAGLLSGLSCSSIPRATVPSRLNGNDNVEYGWPGGAGSILVKQYYVIMHVDSLRIPAYVIYHLTKKDLEGISPRSDDFRPDPELPAGSRAELVDYGHTEFDRGHMAPAADFTRNDSAMSMSFLLSNMAPQRPHLNRIMWKKLEEEVRSLASASGSIWVVTGTLFLDSTGHPVAPGIFIGPNHVAVPTHFYKAILSEDSTGKHTMFAFVLENRVMALTGQPGDYMVTVRHIEQLTGLDFFNRLQQSEQDTLETRMNPHWPPTR